MDFIIILTITVTMINYRRCHDDHNYHEGHQDFHHDHDDKDHDDKDHDDKDQDDKDHDDKDHDAQLLLEGIS